MMCNLNVSSFKVFTVITCTLDFIIFSVYVVILRRLPHFELSIVGIDDIMFSFLWENS